MIEDVVTPETAIDQINNIAGRLEPYGPHSFPFVLPAPVPGPHADQQTVLDAYDLFMQLGTLEKKVGLVKSVFDQKSLEVTQLKLQHDMTAREQEQARQTGLHLERQINQLQQAGGALVGDLRKTRSDLGLPNANVAKGDSLVEVGMATVSISSHIKGPTGLVGFKPRASRFRQAASTSALPGRPLAKSKNQGTFSRPTPVQGPG